MLSLGLREGLAFRVTGHNCTCSRVKIDFAIVQHSNPVARPDPGTPTS